MLVNQARSLGFILSFAAVSVLAGGPAGAQEAAPAADGEQPIAIAVIERDTPVDFESEVLPLLKRSCLACHNATTAESDLVLENPETILKGGASGPAVVAADAAESLLLSRASGQVDTIMPPKDNKVAAPPLSSEELGLIKLWIEQGATGTVSGAIDTIQWQPLPPGVNPIYAVAVTPDGQFAACGRANQIFIYHLPTGRFVCRLTDPELLKDGIYAKPGVADLDLIQSLAFSADGSMLASGGYQTVKLWRRPRDVRLATLATGSANGAQALATSPDGKWLATAGADYSIQVWPLDGEPPAGPSIVLKGHSGPVTCLKFAGDGARLFSASEDKSIRAWQLPDGAAVGQIDVPAPVQAITLVGDGTLLASGGGDNLVRLWKTPSAVSRQVAGLPAPTTALAVSPDRKLLAAAGGDGAIKIVDLATLEVVRTLTGHAAAVHRLAFQPGGSRLASVGADNTLVVWDPTTAQVVARVYTPASPPAAVALDTSGNRAVSGAADGSVSIWKLDVPGPRLLPGVAGAEADEAAATAAAVSPDGKLLATGSMVGGQPAIVVRDIAAGTVVKT
ncbi:MAG: c-type cytochrome domain-containing protein, partial [Pirellulales bacterium]